VKPGQISQNQLYGNEEQLKGLFLLEVMTVAVKTDLEKGTNLAAKIVHESAFVQPDHIPMDVPLAAEDFVTAFHGGPDPKWAL